MKVAKVVIITVILYFIPYTLSAQIIHDLLDKIKIEYDAKNYYTSVNLCRDIIEICNKEPESECWFTNVMKNVYRYKGLSEFEIYKKELTVKRLESSIQSLEISYNLYQDAEILYLYGYLGAFKSVLMKNRTNVDGLVTAWKGIIELYGHNNWIVTNELIDNIKDYIKIAEKFTTPIPAKNYSGYFAKYIILMACKLADKAQLSNKDKIYFNKYVKKYNKNNLNKLLGKKSLGKLTG